MKKKYSSIEQQMEQLRSENYKLKQLVDNLPGDIYWKDKNGFWEGINQHCLHSLKQMGFIDDENPKSVLGRTDFELFNQKTAEGYRKNDIQVMQQLKELIVEENTILKTGEQITLLSIKKPLFNTEGQVCGVLGNTIDISHLKKIEKELKVAKKKAEAASKAKTDFIANMSHDIRTPLSGVIGLSELLEQTLENPEQKEEAHFLHDSGEELLSMLNDILDDVRAGDVKEGDLQEKNFNLLHCIDELVKLERPTTELKHLGLYVDIAENVPTWIRSDKKKIHRILLNLLGNAIKFTHKGHIAIGINCLQENKKQVHLQFRVSDTGIGIPKEIQDKVFDRFFRASPSYKGMYKGHGLGLYIVRSYIKLLNGHISLISKENEGSTFIFTLWCKKGTPPPVINANSAEKNIPADIDEKQRFHFLLVEDSPVVLKVLESLISKKGYSFHSVSSGEKALDLIQKNTFNLIITDIGLPGISGVDLSLKIREWEKKNHKMRIPIIGLTGHTEETLKQKCLETDMDAIFTKPITLSELDEIITRFIGENPFPCKPLSQDSSPLNLGENSLKTEKKIFDLASYALFDITLAFKQLNDLAMLFQLVRNYISEEMQLSFKKMEQAYEQENWEQIEKIVHQIKGGALYIGIRKMYYSCHYFEQYYKTGYRPLLKELYHQIIIVNQQTIKVLIAWLEQYDN